MELKKSRISWVGMSLLVCGLCALSLLFLGSSSRASAASPAFVRVIHASPFVGTADVFLDGQVALKTFRFGEVSPYVAIPEGPHKVQIALTGKGIGASALTETLSVQAGAVYTVAAIGTSAQNLSLEVFSDNNLASVGTAKVRIYQLSPDAGAVNVVAGSSAVADGLTYQQASNYFNVSVGQPTFNVSPVQGGYSLKVSADLKANTVTSIFIVGVFNGSPKIELVPQQVAAVPGLPQTGSDPFATIGGGQLSTPWLLIALAMICIGGTFLTRRFFHSH